MNKDKKLEDVVLDLYKIIVVLASLFVVKSRADGDQSIAKLRQLLTSMLTEHDDLNKPNNRTVLKFVIDLTSAADDEESMTRILQGTLKYKDPFSP